MLQHGSRAIASSASAVTRAALARPGAVPSRRLAQLGNQSVDLCSSKRANVVANAGKAQKELEKAAEQLGDAVKILKVDVDENQQLSSMLKIEGLPTLVFIPKANDKPALRTEGLYPVEQIVQIVKEL